MTTECFEQEFDAASAAVQHAVGVCSLTFFGSSVLAEKKQCVRTQHGAVVMKVLV